jgi:hypothetical protein
MQPLPATEPPRPPSTVDSPLPHPPSTVDSPPPHHCMLSPSCCHLSPPPRSRCAAVVFGRCGVAVGAASCGGCLRTALHSGCLCVALHGGCLRMALCGRHLRTALHGGCPCGIVWQVSSCGVAQASSCTASCGHRLRAALCGGVFALPGGCHCAAVVFTCRRTAIVFASPLLSGVTFLLDVCPTWTRGVALVDLLRRSALHRDKPWDTR